MDSEWVQGLRVQTDSTLRQEILLTEIDSSREVEKITLNMNHQIYPLSSSQQKCQKFPSVHTCTGYQVCKSLNWETQQRIKSLLCDLCSELPN